MQVLRRTIVGLASVLACVTARAQHTTRLSVDPGGGQANSVSSYPLVSPDGRYVLFDSSASNLVAGDTNGWQDVFLRDRVSGVTTLVSVGTGGVQANGPSVDYALSADGRFVAFQSSGSNLASGDTNGAYDIFVHDLQSGQTAWASVSSAGVGADSNSFGLALSLDGRFVSFCSGAGNLVPGDTNGAADVFVRDLQTGQTSRVSVDSSGAQADGQSLASALSGDGRFVAFSSFASNLVPGDTNALPDIFVHDRQTGQTTRVSLDSSGAEGDGASVGACAISADGRWVAFGSQASNLVPGDTNNLLDAFVHDRQTGQTTRVDVDSAGTQSDGAISSLSLSADGRFAAFGSLATNLVSGDTNNASDAFVHDLLTGETTRISLGSAGAPGNSHSDRPAVSSGGRYIAFESVATNLVPGDTNAQKDIFLRDQDATGFTSLCEPGSAGVLPCPCANPATTSGAGCDNSAASGGALVSASGVAYLSSDSLVFTTAGELPNATSILLQGDALVGNGLVFGQGVRCAGGVLKRMYARAAVAGSVTLPGPGDPSVSTRSVLLGDPILPGEPRWYLVYYRDPFVLGGCPATSTFNATQTARVDWSL